MKHFLTTIIFLSAFLNVLATHNRAGQIVYEHIKDYSYKITITTYTYSLSDADRDTLTIDFGDGSIADAGRVQKTNLPDNYIENIYIIYHSFPGPGIFNLVVQDPNRNEGVINIQNSVNVVFALKTTLQISPFLGHNSAPKLLNKPIDKAALYQVFTHNSGAYDLDGDSLSYKMDTCRYTGGRKIPAFSLPSASESIIVDPVSGDLIWTTPIEMGIYNVAIRIEEWRKGEIISNIIRDIQIEVEETDNKPPKVEDKDDICVIAGENIEFDITVTDPDGDGVKLTATGGPFTLSNSPAEFTNNIFGTGTATGTFKWQTNCSHIRKQDYLVTFRGADNNPEVSLSDYSTVKIKVIGPPVQISEIESSNTNIILKWNKNSCENISGYKIYRRNSSENFSIEECTTGVPNEWGYTLVKTISDPDQTFMIDAHVPPGFNYCYRIVALYDKNTEGICSDKQCVEIAAGLPILVKASVDTTDINEGIITVQWLKPLEFDTILHKGPHRFILQTSRDLFGVNYNSPIIFNNINGQKYIDKLINTKDNPSCYKLTLQSFDSLQMTWQDLGYPCVASSPFLKIISSNQKNTLIVDENVPWDNQYYVFYRYNPETSQYDSIGTSENNIYEDKNLENLKEYCYKVKSVSRYTAENLPQQIVNMSQIKCGIPIDTIPPCCPQFNVTSNCDEYANQLKWKMLADTCNEGLKEINVLYTNRLDEPYEKIVTLPPNDSIFIHNNDISISGCYYLSLTDSAGNTSVCDNNKICVDNCNYYKLPNIFTPNSDNINDFLHPYPYRFVEKIDLKVYDRWGILVFETEDPDINWDGKDIKSGETVTDGVYYYICDVYEYRLKGIIPRNISGFIHIYKNSKQKEP